MVLKLLYSKFWAKTKGRREEALASPQGKPTSAPTVATPKRGALRQVTIECWQMGPSKTSAACRFGRFSDPVPQRKGQRGISPSRPSHAFIEKKRGPGSSPERRVGWGAICFDARDWTVAVALSSYKKRPAREGPGRPFFCFDGALAKPVAFDGALAKPLLDVERVLPALGLEAPPAEAFASPDLANGPWSASLSQAALA